jgi:hypothetical protein
MSDGIGGVDETTAVLRAVAAEQRALVDHLDQSVGDAISRVAGMTKFTEQ